MFRRSPRARATRGIAAAAATAVATAGLAAAVSAPAAAGPPGSDDPEFVQAHGERLVLDGRTYEFAGTNQYYLGYKSQTMVDAMLDDAATAGFDVVRTWGFRDYQNPDGSGSVHSGGNEGVWYQAWDPQAGRPVVNGGPDGLERLDYVVAAAGERGLRLVIPFTNNWADFGGIDQYVRWAGGSTHAEFYTDAEIRGWYRAWVSTLLNRVNTVTGVAYKDDPTIMAWELGNEPRCVGSGVYPRGECDVDTITTWAAEMSAHVKSIDDRHLLSVGDEGFFCRAPEDWVLAEKYGASEYGPGMGEDCGDGVDTVALASLPDVDVMSMHLYPDHWKTSAGWGEGWIIEHAREAAAIAKPVYLGEFGWQDKATRMPVFHSWLGLVRDLGVDGAMYWLLSSEQDDGTLYPDYDGFTVYCPSPVCALVSAHASLVPRRDEPGPPAPLADHDTATIFAGETATVDVLANDVTFGPPLRASTLDLAPGEPGVQASVTVPGGTASVAADGTVQVLPDDGFVGVLDVPYAVRDARGRAASATLSVSVKPVPGDPVVLESWETGTAGWAPGNWQTDPGNGVTYTTDWATDGSGALRVSSAGAWFGSAEQSPALDLSAYSTVELDVRTDDSGTSVALALRTGDAWTWCQSPFEWIEPNSQVRRTIELSTMSCGATDLAQVRDILFYFNAGVFEIDRLALS